MSWFTTFDIVLLCQARFIDLVTAMTIRSGGFVHSAANVIVGNSIKFALCDIGAL